MKLTELNKNIVENTKKVFKENYGSSLQIDKLTKADANVMLKKVKGLIKEAKQSSDFLKSQPTAPFMKLVFMEQALKSHIDNLGSSKYRIVVENEEVEKSQVVLAAQDMVDSIQKIIEDVSDMLVKELPALSDSIQSEIGLEQGQQYSTQVSESLNNLMTVLNETKNSLQNSLNIVTGQETPEVPLADLGTSAPAVGGAEEEIEVDQEEELPVEEPTSNVGREVR